MADSVHPGSRHLLVHLEAMMTGREADGAALEQAIGIIRSLRAALAKNGLDTAGNLVQTVVDGRVGRPMEGRMNNVDIPSVQESRSNYVREELRAISGAVERLAATIALLRPSTQAEVMRWESAMWQADRLSALVRTARTLAGGNPS